MRNHIPTPGGYTHARPVATSQFAADTRIVRKIRHVVVLLVAFVALAEQFGLETILGAFPAGAVVGLVDRDASSHPRFRIKLEVLGYGFLISVIFVTSGLRLDLRGLVDDPAALARVPLISLALLVVRGLPAVLSLRTLGARSTAAVRRLQATSLPFIVTATQIGVLTGLMAPVTAAALVCAGLLSVLVFPAHSPCSSRTPALLVQFAVEGRGPAWAAGRAEVHRIGELGFDLAEDVDDCRRTVRVTDGEHPAGAAVSVYRKQEGAVTTPLGDQVRVRLPPVLGALDHLHYRLHRSHGPQADGVERASASRGHEGVVGAGLADQRHRFDRRCTPTCSRRPTTVLGRQSIAGWNVLPGG